VVISTQRVAGGILDAARSGNRRRVESALAAAAWIDLDSQLDTGERERAELLVSVAHRITGTVPRFQELHLSLLQHLAGSEGVSPQPYRVRKATASISTCTSRGKRAASTVARAGALSPKYRP